VILILRIADPGSLTLLGTLSGTTQDGQWLELATTAAHVRYVKVSTTASPSWVAWYEVEVYGAASNTADVEWLVSDQLGTPRMVADLSGSLAGVKRHDYLPFGEEIGAGVGGRTTGQGYGQLDGNRKKWAKLERDDETGLDYAQARYYSSTQGRFTSPDEFTGGPEALYDFVDNASANPTFYATLTNPQSLNKYQYAYNNPLRYIDPNGHEPDNLLAQNPQEPLGPVSCAYCSLEERQKRFDEFKRRIEKERKDNQEAEEAIEECQRGDCRKFDALNPLVQPIVPQAPPSPQLQPRPIDDPDDQGHKTNRRHHDKHTQVRPGEKQPPNYKPFRRPDPKPKPPPEPPKPKPTPKPEIGPDGKPVRPPA
jgi:RHS repeat-associated protein